MQAPLILDQQFSASAQIHPGFKTLGPKQRILVASRKWTLATKNILNIS